MADQANTSPYTLSAAELDWSDQQVPSASNYGDIYFSGQQGLEESRYVFLENSHFSDRWQQLADNSLFTIAETGFGTGLNFLSAWQLWRQTAPATARLHFISTEKHPLTLADIQRALAAWPELDSMVEPLLAQYPLLTPGHHLLKFDGGQVTLQLLFGDAIASLDQLRSSNHPQWQTSSPHSIDAWFLDGFAPGRNPSLWNNTLYSLLADLSHADSTVATFTAVGDVRRGLTEQGFRMEKMKGFGKKREMLRGRFDPSQRQSPASPSQQKKAIKVPWALPREQLSRQQQAQSTPQSTGKQPHVAIIGGGLAGTTSAQALAQRGWQVTLLERGPQLAQGASGNPQGMLYTKLSIEASTLNQFTLSSYLFALRFYRQWQAEHHINRDHIDFCGLLQLATNAKEQQMLQRLQPIFAGLPQLVEFVDAKRASDLAGVAINHPGYWLPQAGWVAAPTVCETLVKHPNISVHYHHDILQLVRQGHQWQLQDKQQHSLIEADAVIIANSTDAQQFALTSQLPSKTIRGQITQLPANPQSAQLSTVICHDGYVTPAIQNHHSLGATFSLGDRDTELRSVDHQHNLDSLQQALPAMLSDSERANQAESLKGRASLRCTTPDYLPMVGPVHDYGQFLTDYADLRKNALTDINLPGSYHPKLYINIGHGSRGLTSTPLCSEILAAMICGEPPPLPRSLIQALNPARFVIRNLIRNKC
jgi:tRNA 5-methylaminomethyl-2-thiouridine biosynthesis bifunctional protein